MVDDHLLDALRYAMAGSHWHYGGGFAPYDEEEERNMAPLTNPCLDINVGNDCCHIWVLYEGFTETYHFCKKCDEKKKDNK